MKKDIMEKWTTALRSGEYKQGRCKLRSDDGYCCLGVLCKISPHDNVTNYNGGVLSADVAYWAGMKDYAGRLPKQYKAKGTLTDYLAILNDRGLSFKQIANIIEHNWEAL